MITNISVGHRVLWTFDEGAALATIVHTYADTDDIVRIQPDGGLTFDVYVDELSEVDDSYPPVPATPEAT